MKARRQKRPLDAAGDMAPPQPLASGETGKAGPFAQAATEAQNRPVTEPPSARGDAVPWIRTPPPEKVDPGMLVPTPPPESVDPGMLIQPQHAERIETPSGRRPKETKSVLISPEAARYAVERARHYTGRFGIVSLAWQLAAEELKKRATITDGVIRLHPPSALDRFVEDYKKSLRGARHDVWDFVEIATRRDEWDAAKASGDPDRMTRAAKRLIDEENARRARTGEPPLPVEQILNPPEGANSPAHANKQVADAHKRWSLEQTGKSPNNEHLLYDPNAAHTHPQSNSDVGPGETANASSSPHANPDAPSDHIVTNGETQRANADTQPGEITPESEDDAGVWHPSRAPDEQARIAADIIMAAPEFQWAEALSGIRANLGEDMASRVASHLRTTREQDGIWATRLERDNDTLTRELSEARADLAGARGPEVRTDDRRGTREASYSRSGTEVGGRATEDLPDKIDYGRTEKNSRPVFVVGMLGAAGPGNAELAKLVQSLGGRVHYGTNDETAANVLAAIRRFQRQHPDGIVVVIGYSHGGRDFAQKIAGKTERPIDIGVFFDPYNANNDIELPAGSVRFGLNFYQQNETDSPWYWPFGGANPYKGSRIRNPEFTNVNLTRHTRPSDRQSKIGHNSIIQDVQEDRELKSVLDRTLRR